MPSCSRVPTRCSRSRSRRRRSGAWRPPEDLAGVVTFLTSDLSRWMTGQVVLADGGLSLANARLSPPKAAPQMPALEAPPAAARTTTERVDDEDGDRDRRHGACRPGSQHAGRVLAATHGRSRALRRGPRRPLGPARVHVRRRGRAGQDLPEPLRLHDGVRPGSRAGRRARSRACRRRVHDGLAAPRAPAGASRRARAATATASASPSATPPTAASTSRRRSCSAASPQRLGASGR